MRVLKVAAITLLFTAGCNRAPKTAEPPKAFGAALVEVSGGKQAVAIGTVLDQPVVVQVNDAQGAPVANALVSIRVPGGGAATPASGLTGADGQFTSAVALGGSSGRYQIVASTRDKNGKSIDLRLDEVALGYQETQGRELNNQYCARCHDPESTPERVSNRDNLKAKAHAFSEGAALNAMSDSDLASIISHGGPALNRSPEMPPYGYTLRKTEIAALMAYIRAIGDPPYHSKGAVYAKN
jgi:mono/diheme cytochrome c family protein